MRWIWLPVLLSACAPAKGDLVISASGEAAAVEGYPTSTGVAFDDGWSIAIDRELVSIDQFHLNHGGTPTPMTTDHVLINLHDAVLQQVWTIEDVDAIRYDEVGYRLVPATADARRIGTVRDEDVTLMTAGHVGFLLDGTATHATHGSYALHIAIPLEIHLTHCMNYADMTDGLVVQNSGTTQVQVTFHLDHLFFDSATVAEPHVRFEVYAAAAGTDRTVTYEDLAMQPLADLRDIDGTPLLDEMGHRLVYDPGSTPLATPTLQAFVYNQATTIGHFNGEGHCIYTAVPVSP